MFDVLRRWRDHHRAERRRWASYGDCPECGHDWRGHDPQEGCGDCLFDISHEEADAPAVPCRVVAPGWTWPV